MRLPRNQEPIPLLDHTDEIIEAHRWFSRMMTGKPKMVMAAFDDSGKLKDTKLVVFGGWAARADNWGVIKAKWLERFKGKIAYLKMTQALRREDQFKGWSEDERDKLLIDLAEIIQPLALGIGGWRTSQSFISLPSHKKRDLKSLSYCAFEACAKSVLKCTKDTFLLYCDDSTEYSTTVLGLYHRMKEKNQDFKNQCMSITFAEDDKFLPLQAADMLAYCLRSHFSNENNPLIEKLVSIFRRAGKRDLKLEYSVGDALGDGKLE